MRIESGRSSDSDAREISLRIHWRFLSIGFELLGVQKSSGRFTTIGSGVLRTTTHRNEWSFEELIS
jgi:hypothetical protein